MLEFQEKIKFRRALYSKISIILLLLLLLVVLRGVYSVFQKQKVSQKNLEMTNNNLIDLKTREKMLTSEIERLKTDRGIEEEIREKYGLVKPGEETLIIIDDSKPEGQQLTTGSLEGFWNKIKSLFISK